VGGKSVVPSTRCLLKAIKRAIKAAHIIWMSTIFKPGRLSIINSLGQGPMQKGIVNIKLMDRPGARESQR
jgi:hypothetical protein